MPDFFLTESGLRVPAIDTPTMIEVDRVAMEETGPNLFQMMENAGRNLAWLALERMRAVSAPRGAVRVLALAGGGGNGGGVICAARHLRNRGVDVLLCLANPSVPGHVPSAQLKIFRAAGGAEIAAADLIARGIEGEAHLILDGLIGYSLRGKPRGVMGDLIRHANRIAAAKDAIVVSLDVPSGTDATTGETFGEETYIRAHATLTLALPKTGLDVRSAGDLFLGDIGIPKLTLEKSGVRDYVSPFQNDFVIPLAW